MPVIIYSSKDPAGVNIAESLKEKGVETVKTDHEIIRCDEDIENIKTDFLIFASKHKSAKGVPSFTVHIPGNWGEAEMGGEKNQISYSNPILMKAMALELEEERKKSGIDFGVTMEADHHGPLVKVPCVFIEIGSTETQWSVKKYGDVLANAIVNGLKRKTDIKEIVFGVGGGHYCPAFSKLELGEEIAISHVLPGYHAENLDYETFIQGIERSSIKVDTVLVDWKGLKGPQRTKILSFVEKAGINWRKA